MTRDEELFMSLASALCVLPWGSIVALTVDGEWVCTLDISNMCTRSYLEHRYASADVVGIKFVAKDSAEYYNGDYYAIDLCTEYK